MKKYYPLILKIATALLIAGILKFSIATLVLAAMIVWTAPRAYKIYAAGQFKTIYVKRVLHFIWDLHVDLARSNFVLAIDVLVPKDLHRVQLIKVPVDDLNDIELALLCHRITLTPGTLACAVSEDRTTLLVHDMYPDEHGAAQKLRAPIDILKGNPIK